MRRSTVLGLIGSGVSASLSPLLHEAEGRAQSHALVYRTIDFPAAGLDPAELAQMLRFASALGFDGLNVTHPFKARVVDHLDEIDRHVELLGAANTIVFRNGRRIGFNTDIVGFTDAFRRELAGARVESVLQLGAGGAGVAVAYALLELGVRALSIHDIAPDRSAALVAKLRSRFPDRSLSDASDAEAAALHADGVVNTTPVGMAGHPGTPLRPDAIAPSSWVADIVYFPRETQLLRAARARGCQTMNGGSMLVYQAAAAFSHFTGLEANAERMFKSFRDAREYDAPELRKSPIDLNVARRAPISILRGSQ